MKGSEGGEFSYIGGELDLFAAAVRWKAYFAKHLRPFIGSRVLEVGAGNGGTTKLLCDGSQQRWVCLEPDGSLANKVRQRIAAGVLPACCSAEVGTVETILEREPAGGFDTLIYIDVLEHIEDDAAEVRRAADALAPGGHLLALSPAQPWLFSPFDAEIGHFRRYTKKSFAALAPPGLSAVKLVYLDSVGMFASLANRLLLKSSMPGKKQIATWDRLMVPLSRLVDPLLRHATGKSVVAVWRKD